MLELDGQQIKIFRVGLLSAFVGPDTFDMFLREDLEKNINSYAGREDSFPVAAFKLIESAQAEGWIDELVTKAYKARPRNRNIAEIAKALGVTIDSSNLEPVGGIQREAPLWKILNPYRGLLALREQDGNFLFGRDEDIACFIETLAEKPSKLFLALGVSGVGKSSLIFAGVFAALDRQSLRGGKRWPERLSGSRTWPRLILSPGSEPLRSLAGAFLRQWLDPREAKFREETNYWRDLLLSGDRIDGLIEALDASLLKEMGDKPSRYVLYIDQGEELYTRGSREPNQDKTRKETRPQKEARRFSELVAEAAGHPRLVVIMSARSDFLGRLQADVPLHAVKHQIDIAPLTPEGLSEVVRRPATALDVAFEMGLDEALIEATREQAGALPLLSDTLDILWKEMQERGDGQLRWARPLTEGVDVAAKLGERADGFLKVHQEQEDLVRRLFCVRLAYVPLQGAASRRTAFLEELTAPERALVDELSAADQRILVTGERDGNATAEIAHEALFTAWQSLRNWINSRRDFYAWVTRNGADREDYEKQGRPSSALLTGRPLERAKSFLETDGEDVPAADRAFIEDSIKADDEMRELARKREADHKAYQEAMIELSNLKALYKETGADTANSDTVDSPVEVFQNNAVIRQVTPPSVQSWGLSAIRADKSRFDGSGCVVAILDSGIDAQHPAFGGLKIIQKDFTGTGNGDTIGHGTFVSSMIAGRYVNNQRFGVAPGVRELLVAKILAKEGGTNDALLNAFQWVAGYEGGRVDVICISLGFDFPGYVKNQIEQLHTNTEEAVAAVLRESLQLIRVYEKLSIAAMTIGKGAVIVAPAGNESREGARVPTTSPLSVARGIISVGALSKTEAGYEVAPFSNSHPSLSAPGVDISAAKLNGGIGEFSGTTPACAYAAGAAALWWQALREQNPNSLVTGRMVTQAMLESAQAAGFAPGTREIDRGAGLVQAPL